MNDDFLFGLRFDFDATGFLRGSAEAQDQLERTVAGLANARKRSQSETEALARSLSLNAAEVKAALRDLDRAQRDHDRAQAAEAREAARQQRAGQRTRVQSEREAARELARIGRDAARQQREADRAAATDARSAARQKREAEATARREEQIAARRSAERHRAEMSQLRERTQGVTQLRDALLSVAALTLGGAGVAGIATAVANTSREGVAAQTFADLTGTNARENAREEAGAALSGRSSREEARAAIGAWANARTEFQRTGQSQAFNALAPLAFVSRDMMSLSHEDFLANIVGQARSRGVNDAQIGAALQRSGLASGGYAALALQPDEMRRFNREGERYVDTLSGGPDDLRAQQHINKLMLDATRLRNAIARDLEPVVVKVDGFVSHLADVADKHPDAVRNLTYVTAVIVATGTMLGALLPLIGAAMALRGVVGLRGAAAAVEAGGGAAVTAAKAAPGALGRIATSIGEWSGVLGEEAAGAGALALRVGVGALPGIGAATIAMRPTATAANDTTLGTSVLAFGSGQQVANREQAEKFWLGQGWTTSQTAGLASRFDLESKFNPFARNKDSGAYGIGQWLGDRKAHYQQMFGHSIESVTDRAQALREQLTFTQAELTTPGWEKPAGDKLRAATNEYSAATIASRNYIRPGATENGDGRYPGRAEEAAHTQIRAHLLMSADHLLHPGAGRVSQIAGADHSTTVNVQHVTVQTPNAASFGADLKRKIGPNPIAMTSNTGQM